MTPPPGNAGIVMRDTVDRSLQFMAGGGEVGALMRSHDWSLRRSVIPEAGRNRSGRLSACC